MDTEIIKAVRHIRFSDNGNGTVTDNNSGLVWSKNTKPSKYRRTCALAHTYIATLNAKQFLGFNDWRLPGYEDFQSLVAGSDFPGIPKNSPFVNVHYNTAYWLNSASYNGSNTLVRYIKITEYGYFWEIDRNSICHVFPVRGELIKSLVAQPD